MELIVHALGTTEEIEELDTKLGEYGFTVSERIDGVEGEHQQELRFETSGGVNTINLGFLLARLRNPDNTDEEDDEEEVSFEDEDED